MDEWGLGDSEAYKYVVVVSYLRYTFRWLGCGEIGLNASYMDAIDLNLSSSLIIMHP